MIDLLCSANKILPRTNVNKNQQEEEDRAAGSGVTWRQQGDRFGFYKNLFVCLTLRTGKTWTGGLKTSGSDDQSPEGWRAQYGKVGQMWRLLIRWGRRRRRRPWKQRFSIFGGSESSAWIKWGTPSWLRVHGEIEDRGRDGYMHRRQIWGRSKVGNTAFID